MSTTADQAFDWIEGWQRTAAKRLEETEMMVSKIDKLRVTAASEGETVKVTVDSHGIVTDLTLSGAVKSQDPDKTAEQIMATMAKARNGLGKGASRIVKDTIGLESATGKAIMAGFRKRLRKPEDLLPEGGAR